LLRKPWRMGMGSADHGPDTAIHCLRSRPFLRSGLLDYRGRLPLLAEPRDRDACSVRLAVYTESERTTVGGAPRGNGIPDMHRSRRAGSSPHGARDLASLLSGSWSRSSRVLRNTASQ